MKKKKYALKRDLNLLPRKQGNASLLRYGLPVFFLLLLLAGAFGGGIVFFQNIKSEKLREKDELNRQIEALSTVQADYEALSREIAVLKSQIANFDDFSGEERTLSKLLGILEKACPSGIDITEAAFDHEKITLSGVAQSDREAASFAVRLRDCGLFSEINLNTVAFNDKEGAAKPRVFDLQLYYPLQLPDASPSAQPGSPQNK